LRPVVTAQPRIRLSATLPQAARLVPALLVCREQSGALRVAALTLLDRLVVAVHRAGAGPVTVVCPGPVPQLKRSAALEIPVSVVPTAPALDQPTLVAATDLLVQAADVRLLLLQRGRLTAADGALLPVGVVPAGGRDWESELAALPPIAAQGVACRVPDAAAARGAERMLWRSLVSASDGMVDRVFNRPCGRPLSKLLIHTPVSPNAVSLASIALGLIAAGCFAAGSQRWAIIGALLFQLSAIVDCVDGDLARVLFKESPLGKWLDLAGDQVVHVSVFAAIALGLMRGGMAPEAGMLGIIAVTGAILSFAVVVRGMRFPAEGRNRLLQKLIDAATNRDFSVLVLVLALAGALDLFLWLAAVGSHLFWMTALALQPWRKRP
jgi:phosphatidylglycerophosphate synthase